MSIVCLTGWQQPANALAAIAPDAVHFDYSAYADVDAMFAALPSAPQLAIGWSLGGQLLVRAIAAKYIKPKSLLLLGAPFQWVTGNGIQGIPVTMMQDARRNYRHHTTKMLTQLNGLIALGDLYEKAIIRKLAADMQVWKHGLYWLDELSHAACADVDFSEFPPTVIVHGGKDKVIYPANAEAFACSIPQAQLQLWPECAHAPHLHDAPALRKLVEHYV